MAKYEVRARIEKVKTGSGAIRYYVEREFKHDGIWRGYETLTGLDEWEAKREAARSPRMVDIEDGTERQHAKSKVQNTVHNAARSRNAVVQKALNATGDKSKQKDWNVSRGTKGVYTAVRFHMPFDMNTWGPWYRGDFKPDRGQVDTDRVRHFYDEASCERFIRDENRKNGFVVKGGEYVLPGYVPKTSWNADTSVLRETAVNGTRSTNAVVAKALNAQAVSRGTLTNQ